MTVLHRAAASTLLLLGLVAPATAQVTSGTILGAVADSSGGVLPGVTVAATNVETGLVHSATTDASGALTSALLRNSSRGRGGPVSEFGRPHFTRATTRPPLAEISGSG